VPTLSSVANNEAKRSEIHVLERGQTDKPKEIVGPRVLGVLLPGSAAEYPSDVASPKTLLARWLIDPSHPLTSRVFVNRLWHYQFGQGIVATPNDFGVMGGNPSHPELLDWLAYEFVANGWHLKPIHRLLVLSATYCQSSQLDPKSPDYSTAIAADAADNLLWHARRQRLEGEELRDAALQIAGHLNLRMFGPSAQPELPQVLADNRYGWDPDKNVEDRDRRSVYVLAKRNMRLPLLQAFDQPDMLNSCPCRTNTTTAPQALEMLNGESTAAAARQWGGKLLSQCGDDVAKIVREAYTDAYGRAPKDSEVKTAEQFVDQQTAELSIESAALAENQLPIPIPKKINRARAAAVVDFCHAVLCSNEFLYVD
jgi:hypothetical protein